MKKITLLITITAVLIAGFVFTNNFENKSKNQKVQTINFETPLEITVPVKKIAMKGIEITVPVRRIAMKGIEITVPVREITMKKALVINVRKIEVAKKSTKKLNSKI